MGGKQKKAPGPRVPRELSVAGRPFQHGLSGYNNHNCGCDVCREAGRVRSRESQALRRARGIERPQYDFVCPPCGIEFKGRHDAVTCSPECARINMSNKAKARAKLKPVKLVRPRAPYLSDLTKEGAWEEVVVRLLDNTKDIDDGCMEWTGKVGKNNYPMVGLSGKIVQVHRLMLQAKHEGKELGVLQAHHICANARCINPEHLQPVTARDNIAEMRARQSYIARIAELEARVQELSPDDELLNRIPLGGE